MRIALVCCPSWSVDFPPYNISLLKAILKQNGHEVKNFDFNIQTYQFLTKGDTDYWEGQNYFHWQGKVFNEGILPKINHLIDELVDSILEYKPDFIGFTIFDTSISCTIFVVEKIRKKDSSVKIIFGGPQCFNGGESMFLGLADYVVTGEGEISILEPLKYPKNRIIQPPAFTKINDLPTPDYEDYDLTKYRNADGISMEASRGCIAKCAFCLETHFWTYRSKKAVNIIKEIKEYIKKYGAIMFRFNDSLVNGNIKEFYKLVNILSEEKLGIRWDGYLRINGEMDLEFMQKIKDSGNGCVSYGIESGSQKVLNDMKKGITIDEAEQNLIDGDKVGLNNHINWMVGFPSEDFIDAKYSLVFLFNNRKQIHAISPGMTCGIGGESDLQLHREKFDVLNETYWGGFVTKDLKNNAINRFIRLKILHIWLDLLNIVNGQYHENINRHYSINFFADNYSRERIEYEECFNFDYLSKETFESTFYAEYMLFFWVIYKAFGAFQMSIIFDKNRDIEEFGSHITQGYNAIAIFNINENGKWTFRLDHSLEHIKPFEESKLLQGYFNDEY